MQAVDRKRATHVAIRLLSPQPQLVSKPRASQRDYISHKPRHGLGPAVLLSLQRQSGHLGIGKCFLNLESFLLPPQAESSIAPTLRPFATPSLSSTLQAKCLEVNSGHSNTAGLRCPYFSDDEPQQPAIGCMTKIQTLTSLPSSDQPTTGHPLVAPRKSTLPRLLCSTPIVWLGATNERSSFYFSAVTEY